MLYYTPGNVAIPCQSTETQIWMSLMNRGRNTEVQGCARTWQLLKCYTTKKIQMRSKGSEADLSEDALPFSLWECRPEVRPQGSSFWKPAWARRVEDSEWRVEEGWLLFFSKFLKFICLYFIYFAYQIFCMILSTFWFLMGAVKWRSPEFWIITYDMTGSEISITDLQITSHM